MLRVASIDNLSACKDHKICRPMHIYTKSFFRFLMLFGVPKFLANILKIRITDSQKGYKNLQKFLINIFLLKYKIKECIFIFVNVQV